MSRHNEMPSVPPPNRSHKGMGDDAEVNKESPKTKVDVSAAEQDDTLTSGRTSRTPDSSKGGG